MFSQVFVHKQPHGYWFPTHPCYSAVGMHPPGMLSCKNSFHNDNSYIQPYLNATKTLILGSVTMVLDCITYVTA